MELVTINDLDFLVNLKEAKIESKQCSFELQYEYFLPKADCIMGQGESEVQQRQNNKIVVSNFETFGKVDVIKEMSFESDYFYALASYSLENRCTVFCGVSTDVSGMECDNVVVASHGALVDIISPTYLFEDGYCTSDKIKVFSSGKSSIALLVGMDSLSEDNWEKALKYCDIMLCIVNSENLYMRAKVSNLAERYKISTLYVDNSSVNLFDGKFWSI